MKKSVNSKDRFKETNLNITKLNLHYVNVKETVANRRK